MQEIEYIECPRCKQPMPALRKTKFGYNFCVNCSNIAPKMGVSQQFGPGEDTYEMLVFIDKPLPSFLENRNINSLEED